MNLDEQQYMMDDLYQRLMNKGSTKREIEDALESEEEFEGKSEGESESKDKNE